MGYDKLYAFRGGEEICFTMQLLRIIICVYWIPLWKTPFGNSITWNEMARIHRPPLSFLCDFTAISQLILIFWDLHWPKTLFAMTNLSLLNDLSVNSGLIPTNFTSSGRRENALCLPYIIFFWYQPHHLPYGWPTAPDTIDTCCYHPEWNASPWILLLGGQDHKECIGIA